MLLAERGPSPSSRPETGSTDCRGVPWPGRRQGCGLDGQAGVKGATAMARSALVPAPGRRDVGIEPIGIRRPRPRHPRSAPDSRGTSAISASALARGPATAAVPGPGAAAGMSPWPRIAAARRMTPGAQQ